MPIGCLAESTGLNALRLLLSLLYQYLMFMKKTFPLLKQFHFVLILWEDYWAAVRGMDRRDHLVTNYELEMFLPIL